MLFLFLLYTEKIQSREHQLTCYCFQTSVLIAFRVGCNLPGLQVTHPHSRSRDTEMLGGGVVTQKGGLGEQSRGVRPLSPSNRSGRGERTKGGGPGA